MTYIENPGDYKGTVSAPGDLRMVSATSLAIGRRPMLDRFTIQLPLMTCTILLLQVLASAALFDDPLASARTINTICATAVVNGLSLFTFRQFKQAPGTRRLAFVLPSFVFPIAIMALLFLGLRLPYTNALLIVGLGAGFGFVWYTSSKQQSASSIPL